VKPARSRARCSSTLVTSVDAFHVVKLGTAALDEVRRCVHQQIHGHHGRSGDPLYGIHNVLRAGTEKLTDRQTARLERAFDAHERHVEVEAAWRCAQRLRDTYRAENLTEGRQIAEHILASFPTCPIPETRRLGKTSGAPRSWPTSTPDARTTAAPKPSTASSSFIDASPEASATAATTGYACCSSVADSPAPTSGVKSPRRSSLGWLRDGGHQPSCPANVNDG
jgi:hypothetical protein